MTQVRLGVVGVGGAAGMMLPSILADNRVVLAAVADLDAGARDRFATDFGVAAYASAEALVASPDVDAVYLATPHHLHAEQAVAAVSAGKHVLVEKPLALTVDDCIAVRDAAERSGRHVVVGHTHAFDRPVLAIARLLGSGELGRLAMVNTWAFGSFLYRPRRPEELDTSRGGGVVYNQLPHQVDVVRLIAGGRVRSVRAAAWVLDEQRPTEGSIAAFLDFEDGAAATLVYNGGDHFDTDELHGWVDELGAVTGPRPTGAARRQLRGLPSREAEAELKAARAYGLRPSPPPPPPERRAQPHFGILVASCALGDVRTTPNGYAVYTEDGVHEVDVDVSGTFPDRTAVIDELVRAVQLDERPLHDAAWGTATLEVCEAILRSARDRVEVAVHHQVTARLTSD